MNECACECECDCLSVWVCVNVSVSGVRVHVGVSFCVYGSELPTNCRHNKAATPRSCTAPPSNCPNTQSTLNYPHALFYTRTHAHTRACACAQVYGSALALYNATPGAMVVLPDGRTVAGRIPNMNRADGVTEILGIAQEDLTIALATPGKVCK